MTNISNLNEVKNRLKLASWNINKFESSSISEIAKVIVDEDLDIIFLQEFPAYTIDKFMNEVNAFSQTQYEMITQQSQYKEGYIITLALIKEDLKNYITFIPMDKDMPLKLRLLELELSINDKRFSILGLHCPLPNKYDNKQRKIDINTFWDKLVNYSKFKDLILIGDFNFNFKKPNKYAKHMKNILNNEYIDLDSELMRNTFIADTRIDYILMHNSLAKLNNNATLITPKYIQDNSSNEFRYSDHRMIIIEIAM